MVKTDRYLTEKECAEEVKLMARRTALLYYYFATTLVQELGEANGKRLIAQAIRAYGEHCGRAVREGVEALGLAPTAENFDKVPDLPHYGWETSTAVSSEGDTRPVATYCPLAATWRALGSEAQKLGRMYCYVDQAKQNAYDPGEEFIHSKNVLDGDPYCEFLVRPRQQP
jgi:hypothetical protein